MQTHAFVERKSFTDDAEQELNQKIKMKYLLCLQICSIQKSLGGRVLDSPGSKFVKKSLYSLFTYY